VNNRFFFITYAMTALTAACGDFRCRMRRTKRRL